MGAPVFPLALPGALFSPGANTCNLVKAAGLTAMAVDVVLVKLPLVNAMVMLFATIPSQASYGESRMRHLSAAPQARAFTQSR